jgi:hypothetical protein
MISVPAHTSTSKNPWLIRARNEQPCCRARLVVEEDDLGMLISVVR